MASKLAYGPGGKLCHVASGGTTKLARRRDEQNPCDPCNLTGGNCCSSNPWTVDFGVGGWSNVNCNVCDDVAGEFEIPFLSSNSYICQWRLYDPAWGEYPFIGGPFIGGCAAGTSNVYLLIDVQWRNEEIYPSTNRPYLNVAITLISYVGRAPTSRANYKTGFLSPGSVCDDLADGDGIITLTATDRGLHYYFDPAPGAECGLLCSGSLPETITLHR